MNDSRKQDLKMFVNRSISKDPITIVHAFNEYFVDIGTKLASRINNSDVNPILYISADSKKNVYLFRMSLNMKLLLYVRVLIIVLQVGIISLQ